MIEKNKGAQVWIETVLYTLIAVALIGIVLAFAMPKINQTKDKLIIEQTISLLSSLDEKINEVSNAPGNVRNFDLVLKRGALSINSKEDKITFFMPGLSKPYSEPGVEIAMGAVKIMSKQNQKQNEIYLTLDYSGAYDITYDGKDEDKSFSQGAVPYKLSIASFNTGIKINIDINSR